MGAVVCKNFTEEDLQSQEIDKLIAKERVDYESVQKLLLLGTGEGGKTTFLRQMKVIYMGGFDKEELGVFVGPIQRNVVSCFEDLLSGSEKFEYDLDDSLQAAIDIIEAKPRVLLSDYADPLEEFWRNDVVQEIFKNHASELQMLDSTNYYLDNLQRICAVDYSPTVEDVVRVRIRTTAISEVEFQADSIPIQLVDVGGQRSCRRKWIHCFEGVSGIMFIVSLAEYDMVLKEDPTKNRMKESLDVFEGIVNSAIFKETPVVLFLNKNDLFLEKIKRTPITACFKSYTGTLGRLNAETIHNESADWKMSKNVLAHTFFCPTGDQTAEASAKYIEKRFLKCNKNKEREIHVKRTVATDSSNVETVFAQVTSMVMRQAFEGDGMM